jgi:2-keto-3-deoxy-L-fuconate dehydrogenase
MFNLKDKVCIVTGGASGIGEAISRRFDQAGAKVAIVDLNEAYASKLAGELNNAKAYACDVSDHNAVTQVVEKIKEAFGTIDVLINNAGIAHIGNVENTSPDDLDRIYNVNVKGVYNFINPTVKIMLENGGGSILNLASIASIVGIADRFAYSMSKGAVQTMTMSVAKDYIDKGIRCNCLCPARVHTPFVDGFIKKNYPGQEKEMFEKLSASQPIGRMGKPEEIAALAHYLCSDDATFVTGSSYEIDGGFCNLI